jgi:ketosteroid isomerase-like protein
MAAMTSMEEAAVFVAAFQKIRDTNDSAALGRLWHPDGTLTHPNLSHPISGTQLPAFNDRTLERLPDLRWELVDWATRGDVVYLEWTCSATVNGVEVLWGGVDRVVLRAGRIAEEVVYCDTMPLLAARDPALRRPASIDADLLAHR